MPGIKDYFIATRPWSFTMSVISVSIGTLMSAETGPIHWGWFGLVVFGIILFHAAVNVINDYYDTRHGVDLPDSPTAKYRPHPIISGTMTSRQLLAEAVVLFIATITIGVFLSCARSMIVLWIGIIGFVAGLFYTAGPVKYKYLALGELSVFAMWGPLMVEGAYAVQRDSLSWTALYVSIPFGVLVALVLLANNIRDIDYDARQGIHTLGTILGHRSGLTIYLSLIVAAYLSMIALVVFHVLTPWGLLVFLSLPKAFALIKTFRQRVPEAADAITAQLDTIFGILLIAGLGLDRLFPL